MALELIKISEFPESSDPKDWIVVSDSTGTAYKLSKDNLKAFLGTVTVTAPRPIKPTDPAPTLDGVYIPTVDGTYANAGGLKRETDEGQSDYGMAVEFIKNGDVWVKNGYPLPIQDVSGLASKEAVEHIHRNLTSVVNESKNLIDKSNIVSGCYLASVSQPITPVKVDSVNWISIRLPIEGGTVYTLSGTKNLTETSPRVYFERDNGTIVTESIILGSGQSEEPITFTSPEDGEYIIINIATQSNIGLTPTDNEWANRVQLEKGSSASDYSPFGVATLKNIKSKVIQGDINPVNSIAVGEFVDEEIDKRVGSFIRKSVNLTNKLEIKSGRYVSSGAIVSSDNWIRYEAPIIGGETYTLQGVGAITSASSRVVFKRSNGTVISESTIIGGSAVTITFTAPADASQALINIAQGNGIGLTPTDNAWANKLQLQTGSVATEYEPYGYELIIPDFDLPSSLNLIKDSRTPYPPTLPDVEILPMDGITLIWVDRFGLVYGRYGDELHKSTDSADTWTLISKLSLNEQSIETVRDLEDGELLVTTRPGATEPVKVFKSTGWNNGSGTSVSFTEKFTTGRIERVISEWGVHAYQNRVVISEYGIQNLATKIWLSKDYGETFAEILDYTDYAIDTKFHTHATCIDPYRDMIWATFGDGVNAGIAYSRNDGDDWTFLQSELVTTWERPHQMVTVFPMPDCVMFLTDRVDFTVNPQIITGVYRIDITPDNINSLNDKNLKLAMQTDDNPILTQLGGNAFKNYYNGDQPTYFSFRLQVNSVPTKVPLLCSFDGRTIFKIWESPELPASGGFRMVVGPDANGKILAEYNDGARKLFRATASAFI